METKRLVFSGSGGQGVITAAIILAEAAALYEGLEAVQSQSYGPEARGGATRTDVIISNRPVFYPKVGTPGILVCLTQEAYNKYGCTLRPGGMLLTDSRYVVVRAGDDARHASLPMYKTVVEKLAQPVVFNICMLGALLGLTRLIKPEAIMKSLETRLPQRLLDVNRQALEIGLELGESVTV
jgi:2-oxoglutarate ferredoxin oxidoreductase subunit gamma